MKEDAEAAVETAKGVLQDLVVVVSLVRTLTESFGSASDLYRKLKRRSKNDSSEDEEASSRKRHRKPLQRRGDTNTESDRERGRHHITWHHDAQRERRSESDSDEAAIQKSSTLVQAEYERGYEQLGEAFARGDLMTQTQLQAQIIELQRTLLTIHQDYMLSTYLSLSSSHSHLVRLIQTTRSARAACVQALHLQYRRMLSSIEPHSTDHHRRIPGSFPLPLPDNHTCPPEIVIKKPDSKHKCSSPDDKQTLHIQPYPNPPAKPHLPPGNKLFCVYARDLQDHSRLPLTDNYKPGGDNLCPFCHSHIATRPGKAWEIVATDGGDCKARTFVIKNRFVVKSHRESGGFTCVLCARFRASDTVCKNVAGLMEHLWRDHVGGELERDYDVVEIEG